MLEECELEYEVKHLEYGTSMKASEYLALNPMGKVPAIQHGDTVITEVAAILAYLADLVPHKKLAPALGSPERGSYYRWMFFVANVIEPLMSAKSVGHFASPQQAGYGDEESAYKAIEVAVSGRDYLCGTHFSAADLFMSTNLMWYMSFGLLPKRPEFERFAALHMERAAAKRAYELDGDLPEMDEFTPPT